MGIIDSGLIDPIDRYLEKNKDRLGPLYQPLYVLSGAIVFLIVLTLILVLPSTLLKNTTTIVFLQIALVAVYYILLKAIRQNVFNRFVFSTVVFLVLTAAPNVIGVQLALDSYLAAKSHIYPSFLDSFLYAIERGLPSTLWAAPLLFYFYTFAPNMDTGRPVALRLAVGIGLGLHAVGTGLTIWLSGLWQRFTASTTGAVDFVASDIRMAQSGFLIFSCLYLGTGYVGLAVAWFKSQAKASRVELIGICGMLLAQIFFAVCDYNVRSLNRLYPAALTTGSAVEAFGTADYSEFAFVNGWYRQVAREQTQGLMLHAACHSPATGRFDLRIASSADFETKYSEPVALAILADKYPTKRFCQPTN